MLIPVFELETVPVNPLIDVFPLVTAVHEFVGAIPIDDHDNVVVPGVVSVGVLGAEQPVLVSVTVAALTAV
jgi:hypothetical protein